MHENGKIKKAQNNSSSCHHYSRFAAKDFFVTCGNTKQGYILAVITGTESYHQANSIQVQGHAP